MTESITVPICVLPHGKDLDMPGYATPMSAGLDLRSAISASDPIVVHPGDRCLVPTGIQIGLPEGFEAQVRPRSGLAVKHGVTVLNAPGTVDADYRGEIGVILVNHGQEPFEIRRGDRIAQLVIARFAHVTWSAVDSLEVTARGTGGFGHSGH